MELQRLSDAELAWHVRQGAPGAFAELTARHSGLVRAKASHFAGPSAPEKEDLLQEGFLGLYAAALTFDEAGGASFATYAGVCIYNRMASAARSHSSPGNRLLNESLPLDSAGELPLPAAGPECRYELRESFAAMWRGIEQKLTPLELRALRLFLGGCKRGEIERQAGMTLRQFDNALHRVRLKLRNL